MFDKHPKGLIAAALANLGERFGFYTMMAILVDVYKRQYTFRSIEVPVRFRLSTAIRKPS